MPSERGLRPRKQPQQARAHETRQRILNAAAHVFAEHGYAAGTTNRIADAASMSVGSLYQYFPNKDSIVVELARAHVRKATAALQAMLAGGLPDALEARLRMLIDATFVAHQGGHRLHQVLFEQAPRAAVVVAELRAAEDALVDLVTRNLAGDPAVTVADHELAARLVVTTVEAAVHRVVTDPVASTDAGRHLAELAAMLHCYLTHPH